MLLRINSKSDEGKALREKYSVRGVPTVILFNGDGTEIDRLIGYDKREPWLKQLLSYAFNMGTLSDLISKSKDNGSADLFYQISGKYYDRGSYDKALENIELARTAKGMTDELKDNLELLSGECYLEKDPEKGKAMLAAIVQKGSGENSETAFDDLSSYFRRHKDDDALVSLYKSVLPRKGDDAEFLNSYAWTMGEIGKELPQALEAAKKAVQLSKEDPQILDTLAEIYYKLGDGKSAVETIDKAIQKEPNDEYYKGQRQKFLDKKKKGK